MMGGGGGEGVCGGGGGECRLSFNESVHELCNN